MERVVKHTKPTRYDKHPRGTLWEIEGSIDGTYIQINEDDQHPTWHPFGYVLEVASAKCIKSPRFIRKVLDIFQEYQ